MVEHTVKLRVNDEAARGELERLILSIPEYAIDRDDGASCDLLFFEITAVDVESQFDFVRQAMSLGMAGQVFLVSGVTDPDILIQALKLGAKGFFTLPLKSEEVTNALHSFRAAGASLEKRAMNGAEKEGTIIYVLGSKGGAGTTTVAVNLAANLLDTGLGKTVSLIDMNLLFGDIPIFLGMESPLFDWAEIARNITRLDSTFLMGTLYKHPSGLHVLPSPSGIFEAFSEGPEIITKLLRLMRTMFDYVVIDGGQDLGEMSRSIMKLADRVIVVSLLNLPSLINVKRLRETFLRLGYPSDDRVSIVANRVQKRSERISVEDAERTVRKRIAWTVPNDFHNTMNAINMGKTLPEIARDAEINRYISEIAASFHGQQIHIHNGNKKKKGFFGGFL